MSSTPELLFENTHYRIEHSSYYRIAGFLFVLPKKAVYSITELCPHAAAELGPTLQLAVTAVETTLKPLNIYYTKFGESGSPIHFHVFPRTKTLTQAYQARHDSNISIDGPHLMSWANNQFTGDNEHGNINKTIEQLRDFFNNAT